MITPNRRTMLTVIPARLRKLWKDWDLRLAILISLILQILLTILGSRRKCNRKLWMRIIVWFAYTAADSVAIFALGIISNNLSELLEDEGDIKLLDPNIELTTFWAQLLLLHLGGPDSITAYALEDNELWSRQLLGLATQTCGSLYVFLLAWTGKDSPLSKLSILMLIAGFIKYAERTWVLWAASNESVHQQFDGDSTFGRHYTPAMEDNLEYDSKRDEGYILRVETCQCLDVPVDVIGRNENVSFSDDEKFLTAYGLLPVTKCLFADVALYSTYRDSLQTFFTSISFQDAFEVIEIQLGMIYDLLYTKAPLLHSRKGFCLRIVTFFLTLASLVLFSSSAFRDHDKHKYSKVDVSITMTLLVVAFLLEIYAALVLLFSDWFSVWLSKKGKKIFKIKTFASLPLLNNPRWSYTMSQYTLLSVNGENKHLLSCVKFLPIWTQKHSQWDTKVTEDLKEMILRYFHDKADEFATTGKLPFPSRDALKTRGTTGIWDEFEHQILVWSIVTDLLYYKYRHDAKTLQQKTEMKYKTIKRISRYMLYLLFNHPSMISAELGLMVVRFPQITESFRRFRYTIKEGDIRMSYEDEGNKEVQNLFQVVINCVEELKKVEGFWEKLEQIWMDLLAYAAVKSRTNEHAQQLRHGGEFLTHVWLLMALFGLTNHFKLSRHYQIGRIIGK